MILILGPLIDEKVCFSSHFDIGISDTDSHTRIAAIQITISERTVEGSNIKNFSDGLWWAVTTVTTVGYGDRFPTTSEGRLLAVMLMIVGISLVGVITASVAAWFVKMSQDDSGQR